MRHGPRRADCDRRAAGCDLATAREIAAHYLPRTADQV